MSHNLLLVETLDEDRFARTTQMTLGDKAILTPNFFTLVQNSAEFTSLIDLCLREHIKNLGGCVIRLFDAPNTILPRLRNRQQVDLNAMRSVELPFLQFNRKNLIIVDPAPEYLLYEFHASRFLGAIRRLAKSNQSTILYRYLEEREAKKEKVSDLIEYERWKKAFHKKFWYELDRNPMEKGKFVGDFLDLETMCGTDIYIPPVPIVDSDGLLDIAIRINGLAKAIAPRTKPCATYILLQKSVLRNDAMMEKITAYIKADPSQLTIFKIKNLDLWSAGNVDQRESYRKLMDIMYSIRKTNPLKLFMALENWFVSFASACYGFNIVSTSMHGYDKDSEFGTNSYGSWFDPELMYYRPFETLQRIMRNNHNHLPCYCSVCRKITDFCGINPDSWNMMRREHYVMTMNEYMRMITKAIADRHIELVREKLANSELSKLQMLIPRN